MKWKKFVKGKQCFLRAWVQYQEAAEPSSIHLEVEEPFESILILPDKWDSGRLFVEARMPSLDSAQVDSKPDGGKLDSGESVVSKVKSQLPANSQKVPFRTFPRQTVFMPVSLIRLLQQKGIPNCLYDHAAMVTHVHLIWKRGNYGSGIPIAHSDWNIALGISERWAKEAQNRLSKAGVLVVDRTIFNGKRMNRYRVSDEIKTLLDDPKTWKSDHTHLDDRLRQEEPSALSSYTTARGIAEPPARDENIFN